MTVTPGSLLWVRFVHDDIGGTSRWATNAAIQPDMGVRGSPDSAPTDIGNVSVCTSTGVAATTSAPATLADGDVSWVTSGSTPRLAIKGAA